MKPYEALAAQIYCELRAAASMVMVEGWKFQGELVPMMSSENKVLLDRPAVIERIRQIVANNLGGVR